MYVVTVVNLKTSVLVQKKSIIHNFDKPLQVTESFNITKKSFFLILKSTYSDHDQ
jgi:hypothetical protein